MTKVVFLKQHMCWFLNVAATAVMDCRGSARMGDNGRDATDGSRDGGSNGSDG